MDGNAGRGVSTPGACVVITGDIRAAEDVTIDGQVTGTIELADYVLTIGPCAKVQARILAKIVTISGTVRGDVTARDRVDIRGTGSLDGNVVAPHIALMDGAYFHGTVTGPSSDATQRMRVRQKAQTA